MSAEYMRAGNQFYSTPINSQQIMQRKLEELTSRISQMGGQNWPIRAAWISTAPDSVDADMALHWGSRRALLGAWSGVDEGGKAS